MLKSINFKIKLKEAKMTETGIVNYSQDVDRYIKSERALLLVNEQISPEKPTDELLAIVQEKQRVETEQTKLFLRMKKEAEGLNNKYNQLLSQIADFRRKKLGMTEEQEASESPSLEHQVEVWSQIYQEEGINIDAQAILEQAQIFQSELSEEDKHELTWLIIKPSGINEPEAWSMVKAQNPNQTWQRSEERRVGKECRSRWSP